MNVIASCRKGNITVILSTEVGEDMPASLIKHFEKYSLCYSPRMGNMERDWMDFKIDLTFEDVNYVVRTLNRHGVSGGPLIKFWHELKEGD